MRKILIVLFLTNLTLLSKAQKVQHIANKPIQEALLDLEQLVGQQISYRTKLVGIGEVATFAKESQRFNMALTAYLISKQGFSTILLEDDDWKVRVLNEYLISEQNIDTVRIDSLVRFAISAPRLRTGEFKEFIYWVKQHNLLNPNAVVSMYGVSALSLVPVDYLVNNYITPIDYKATPQLVEKWLLTSPSMQQVYHDIEEWINRVDTNSTSFEVTKLIQQYRKDIACNRIVIQPNPAQTKLSISELTQADDYTLKQILERSEEKAIFYSSNARIVKSDLQSNQIIDNPLIATLGKNIHLRLGNHYRAFITDFYDSATLPIIDLETRKADLEEFAGAANAKKLAMQGDAFFLPKDLKMIANFIPVGISFVKGQVVNLLLDEKLHPADAVFLFPTLTHADILQDRN